MPVYEYICRKCGHSFEQVERIAEHGTKKVRCPKCKSQKVEQLLSLGFVKTSKKS